MLHRVGQQLCRDEGRVIRERSGTEVDGTLVNEPATGPHRLQAFTQFVAVVVLVVLCAARLRPLLGYAAWLVRHRAKCGTT